MSTDVADATTGSEEKKGRGGPRGERQWREKPNARERVMNQNLAEFIKEKTGREVSTESIRAVRHCLLKWMNSDDTKKLRDNMDSRLQREKLQDKREKALAMLAEADSARLRLTSSTVGSTQFRCRTKRKTLPLLVLLATRAKRLQSNNLTCGWLIATMRRSITAQSKPT